MVPQDYTAWHYCITILCGIKLDQTFIIARIKALENKHDSVTQNFIQLYGIQHYEQVISWFYLAKQSITA
jgi:hypothetical protein